jgi:hypothetical protein
MGAEHFRRVTAHQPRCDRLKIAIPPVRNQMVSRVDARRCNIIADVKEKVWKGMIYETYLERLELDVNY